jgi:hypothetical protein
MARFIAIPVAQGDAFYLERENLSVLIDGGNNRSAFSAMFQAITRKNSVDIVVCTHNDADHTKGLIGYLESGLGCREVWLPGRWLSVLPDVLKPFVDVFVELVDNVSKAVEMANVVERPLDRLSLETYGEYLQERLNELDTEDRSERAGEDLGRDGWTEPLVNMLERAEPWEEFWFSPWPRGDLDLIHSTRYWRLRPEQMRLLFSAIEAASRIRAIAIEAYHRGIPIRWFEYDFSTPNGGVPELQPLNATAIARVRPRVGTLLRYLTLTVTNKQSLVFWSPPADQDPGVLFTADSDLAGCRLPSQFRGALATAPHHGSEANAQAYRVVASAAQQFDSTITWIRSDGRYRSRPGSAYLAISSRRFCTICRRNSSFSTSKQAVQLFSRQGSWVRHPDTSTCVCQKE